MKKIEKPEKIFKFAQINKAEIRTK